MTIHLSIPDYQSGDFEADLEAIKLGSGRNLVKKNGKLDISKVARKAIELWADKERAS